jgi:hypothetical protein
MFENFQQKTLIMKTKSLDTQIIRESFPITKNAFTAHTQVAHNSLAV